MTKRILFVCLGNICRSPTAEGVFRSMLSKGDAIETDSAGTGDYHIGNRPDARAIAEAAGRGIDISDLRARQIEPEDFDRFDVIIAMDRSNLNNLKQLAPTGCRADLRLMVETREVPDPYYDGQFSAAYDLIETACRDLLAEL